MRLQQLIVAATLLASGLIPVRADAQVRMNQIQVIGTHNSYHIEPHPSVMAIIRQSAGQRVDAIQYTHRPLPEQFGELGIRQIELDIYADPLGGHYANPIALKMVTQSELPAVPDPDPEGELKEPGLKIIHAPDVDFFTTVRTFVGALKQIKEWSDEHPKHVPIMILLEVKQSRLSPILTKPMPFDEAALNSIDEEIKSVFPLDRIVTPSDVRGDAETLRDAVTNTGWPLLDDVRGKVIFALDNRGEIRDLYIQHDPSLAERILFVSVDADHPAAAFMGLNDPVAGFDHIQEMVRLGFLVRTRADADTRQAREDDGTRRDKAFASGAQYVSTDYPEPNEALSGYKVELPGAVNARANPVNGNGTLIETVGRQK